MIIAPIAIIPSSSLTTSSIMTTTSSINSNDECTKKSDRKESVSESRDTRRETRPLPYHDDLDDESHELRQSTWSIQAQIDDDRCSGSGGITTEAGVESCVYRTYSTRTSTRTSTVLEYQYPCSSGSFAWIFLFLARPFFFPPLSLALCSLVPFYRRRIRRLALSLSLLSLPLNSDLFLFWRLHKGPPLSPQTRGDREISDKRPKPPTILKPEEPPISSLSSYVPTWTRRPSSSSSSQRPLSLP